MKFKQLGKTNLTVSTVGIGGLGRKGFSPEVVRLALEGGLNYIDTACTYGDSELIIGKALAQFGNRDKIVISSKCIYRDLKVFQENFERSLTRLGTDYLDIMLVHDVSTQENWRLVRENGIVDYLHSLAREGRVLHVGCSTHDAGVGVQMIDSGFFEVIMLAYNAANPEAQENLIPAAKAAGMGIVVMKPLGGGVLTEVRSRELGFAISAEDSLRYVLSHPDVDTVIPGLNTVEEAAAALKVWNEDVTLSAEARRAIADKVTIKGRNYCRGCGYCQPCPQGIPIPDVLALHNRWEIYSKIDWAQKHLIRMEFSKLPAGRGPERCVKCGACVARCPYSLPIPQLMDESLEMRV
jgi:predicted aldo/keto reductase-like oxidoreductase